MGRDCIVYAHNGGKFDWHFLLQWLTPWAPIMVIAGRIAKFKIGKAEFRDSYNIMPMPLAAVQKESVDYDIFEPELRDIPENRTIIEKYLKSDCVNLYGMLTSFIDEFGLHLTQAGASIKAWERITGEKAPNTTADFYNTLAPHYYGGRVQVFKSGEINTPFVVVDINSAYPYAMMSEHPTGDTIDAFEELPDSDDEISRAFITLEAGSNGAFPFRARDKSLRFPSDGLRRVFHVTGWEYLAARETGTLDNPVIVQVLRLPGKIEYSSYLNHFYSMKTEAKHEYTAAEKAGDSDKYLKWKARYEFSKRFLNSLYGKHGANPSEYQEFTIVSPENIESAEMEGGYMFSALVDKWALVCRDLPEEKQRYYNVATAASITGFVRAMLWRAIRGATGVIYCDTDAIMCESPGSLDLDPERLGAWDVEATCDYGAIAAKKLYAVRTSEPDKKSPDGRHWKTACKGVKLSQSEIVRVARGERIKYSPIAPTFSVKRGIEFTPRTVARSTQTDE